VLNEPVRVPDVVTGLPDTVNTLPGRDRPTLVTVPVPPVEEIVVVPPVVDTVMPEPPTISWLAAVSPLMLNIPLEKGYLAY
jgi:hypothetical protein